MRWTLRTLMISMALFAIIISVLLGRHRSQERAIETITSHGGVAIRHREWVGFGELWERNAYRPQTFAESVLSVWNKPVTSVKFDMRNYDPKLNEALRSLPTLSQIRICGVENQGAVRTLKEQFPKIEILDEDEFLRTVIH